LHDAVWGLGAQTLVGAVLGLVWLAVAPRPSARWAGTFWYAESAAGFSGDQDVRFALVTVVPGLVVGVLLACWAGRERPVRRAACWLGGAVLGSMACWLTGVAFGSDLAGAPAVGAVAQAAPVTLTSYGLLALWPFAAAVAMALPLGIRGAFGRTW
jgi:hypothetical protein